MIEGRYPFLLSCERRPASLHSQKHQLQRCSKDEESEGEGREVSHIPLKHNESMHRLDARIWKVIICRPKGMELLHGPDGISTTGKKGQPITILCSIVGSYQRPTKAVLWLSCYLICVCLFMCHVYLLPMGVSRCHLHV